MLLRLLAVLGLVSACNSAQAVSTEPPFREHATTANPDEATRRTFAFKSTTGTFCGAVAVGPALLATAEHCVGGLHCVYASHDEPDNWLPAVVFKRDAVRDLAIVATFQPLTEWAKLSPAHRGQRVYSIHHGGGRHWHIESGAVEGEPRINKADWTQTDVPVSPGASGAGLWDYDNNLTGIVSWYKGSSSYFVPAREVDALIR